MYMEGEDRLEFRGHRENYFVFFFFLISDENFIKNKTNPNTL